MIDQVPPDVFVIFYENITCENNLAEMREALALSLVLEKRALAP